MQHRKARGRKDFSWGSTPRLTTTNKHCLTPLKQKIMENFVKTSCEIVNGQVKTAATLLARSLVLVNTKNGAMYNVAAKCRNTDALSVCKALAKAVLAAKRVEYVKNSDKDAELAKRRVTNPMNFALSGQFVAVVNNKGEIISDSILMVDNGLSLRTQFRFTKSQDLYKLVVEQNRDWNDSDVVKYLNAWCNAAIKQWHYAEEFDAAIGAAADNTEAEQKAAEKAAKAEQKAAA